MRSGHLLKQGERPRRFVQRVLKALAHLVKRDGRYGFGKKAGMVVNGRIDGKCQSLHKLGACVAFFSQQMERIEFAQPRVAIADRVVGEDDLTQFCDFACGERYFLGHRIEQHGDPGVRVGDS